MGQPAPPAPKKVKHVAAPQAEGGTELPRGWEMLASKSCPGQKTWVYPARGLHLAEPPRLRAADGKYDVQRTLLEQIATRYEEVKSAVPTATQVRQRYEKVMGLKADALADDAQFQRAFRASYDRIFQGAQLVSMTWEGGSSMQRATVV